MNSVADAGASPHRIAVRVRYPETDRMKVAYHANYLVWFELGRTELMRSIGCPYGELEEHHGISFPVLEVRARYRRPAVYDDVLDVHTRLSSVTGARVRFEYEVIRRDDDLLLATGLSEHACVGPEGRPVRIPAVLRGKLEGWGSP